MKRHAWTLVLTAILASCNPIWGQQDQAALKEQLAGIQSLRTVRPDDGLLAYYEAMTQAQLGDKTAALKALRSLLGRRLGLIPAAGLGFDDLWKDDEFQGGGLDSAGAGGGAAESARASLRVLTPRPPLPSPSHPTPRRGGATTQGPGVGTGGGSPSPPGRGGQGVRIRSGQAGFAKPRS